MGKSTEIYLRRQFGEPVAPRQISDLARKVAVEPNFNLQLAIEVAKPYSNIIEHNHPGELNKDFVAEAIGQYYALPIDMKDRLAAVQKRIDTLADIGQSVSINPNGAIEICPGSEIVLKSS